MNNLKQINPTLTKKQKQTLKILNDNSNGINEILYGGAAGGGKSYLGCLWLISCCFQYPETRWLIGRSKLTNLKKTTLKTFFEVCQKLELKEGEHFKYNSINNEIKFCNGSEIMLKDLFQYPSDPEFDSLGSLEIAGGFIDEANQITEKAKNIVMSRMRHKLDEYKIIPRLLMSCNPSRNWTYNEYYKKYIDGKLEPYKMFIQALNNDNEFLTKHYTTNLDRLDEISKKRLKDGLWDYEDELAIFKYDSILELFNTEYDEDSEPDSNEPNSSTYISIDVARLGKDKTTILVWDGLDVIEILELSKKRLNEQTEIIKELQTKYAIPNKRLIIDSDGVGGGLADNFSGCIEIINNSKPLKDENYQNLKTQLYYKLAELTNDKQIKIFKFNDSQKLRLTQELQIIKREKIDQDGKVCMTNKDGIKQQIGRSPDISDAMAYRMYVIIKPKNTSFGIRLLDL